MKTRFEKALFAIYNDNLNELKSILNNFSNIDYLDENGRSLIFYAILHNNIQAVNLLLAQNAKVNLHDKEGWTPLHYAVNEHLIDIVELLISSGADVNAKDAYGNNIIWRAVFASKGRGEIIKVLLENGANPSNQNDKGINALKLAETIGNYEVRKFLTPN